MNFKNYFKSWKKIGFVSFGLVYVMFNIWVIFHLPEFVPEAQVNYWFRVFISYMLLNLIVFANENIRNKLFNVRFIDFIPRFLFFTVVFFVIFYLVLSYVDPFKGSIFDLMYSIPVWLGLTHAFTFATIESLLWQGYLDNRIGHPWSEITAGLFHYGVWAGDSMLVIISASSLFFIFSLVHWLYKRNTHDFAPVIGCHFAFNAVKLGTIIGAGGALNAI